MQLYYVVLILGWSTLIFAKSGMKEIQEAIKVIAICIATSTIILLARLILCQYILTYPILISHNNFCR